MVGGPSIIFHRYHEAGKNKIREKEMEDQGKQTKTCQKVVGYDGNALYLWPIIQDMSTGSFQYKMPRENWLQERKFFQDGNGVVRVEGTWRRNFYTHQMYNTEKRIGERKIKVDGFHGSPHSRSVPWLLVARA